MSKLIDLMLEVCRDLRDRGIEFMIVGAVAAAAYGEGRTTKDIDIVVKVPFEDRERVGVIFDEKGWPREDKVDPIWGKRIMAYHPSRLKVEIFFAPRHPLHEREFDRRVEHEIEGEVLPFLSPEDVILRKLDNTKHRRAQDYDDVMMVIAVQGDDLDLDYIREHCGVHRVCKLFERALQDAETIASGEGQAWDVPEEGWPPEVADAEE